MNQLATDIDRKLCLTAALVGAVSRKDLAAAFRRANPQTSFDIERAHKWLQGRAKPREQRLYDDWALVLDVNEPGGWIADCDLSSFIDVLCSRRNQDRDQLLRRAQAFAGGAPVHGDRGSNTNVTQEVELAGSYVCYSHAWSPYFKGRLIRGALMISHGSGGLVASYAEMLPTGRLVMSGPVDSLRNGLHLSLREPEGRTSLLFSLFPPSSPFTVLGGLMCGPTVIGSEPQPSVSRIIILRLPAPNSLLESRNAYLPSGATMVQDLADLDLPVADPKMSEELLYAFLSGDGGHTTDRAPIAAYRAVVECFDREWITRVALPPETGPI